MKVVIIAVLLMLSAICSATETAFSSCNRIRLKKLADDGNKSAKKAMNICDNFDKALTALSILPVEIVGMFRALQITSA